MPAIAPAANRAVATTDNLRPPLATANQLKVDFVHLTNEIVELEQSCAEAPGVIEDDEDLATVTRLATSIIALAKRIEDTRKEQVRPFLDAEKTVNDFLKQELPGRLSTLKTRLETVTTVFQRKKAAREQAARDAAAAVARKAAEEAAQKVTEAVKAGNVQAATTAVKEADTLAAFANKAATAAAAPVNSMGKVTTEGGTASLVDNWSFDELDLDKIDLIALRPFFPRAAVEQAIRAFIKSGRREIVGARIFNDNKSRFRG